MNKWFKKYFIPHEGNNHEPHFLRSTNVQLLVLVVFMIELGVLALPYVSVLNPANNKYFAAVLPAVLDNLSNQNRKNNHLPTLSVNSLLNKVAELKAKDMANKGYFAHISPDGKTPWYWFNLVGYKYEYAGENLAVNFTDSEDVALAWMNSPTHRENIIKNAYTEIGTGVASGTYNGLPTIYVAQVYGRPTFSSSVNISKNVVTSKPEPKESTSSTTKVLGASVEALAPVVPTPTYLKPTIFEQMITSPRRMANTIFVILGVIVFFALGFKLFIKVDKKHPVLITNGLIVLILLFGVYTINNLMAKDKMDVTTSFASFAGEQFDSIK